MTLRYQPFYYEQISRIIQYTQKKKISWNYRKHLRLEFIRKMFQKLYFKRVYE